MPTLKQKKAFDEIGVNGGNISKAMKTAGYSESVSKRTDKLTNTKGWEELMKKHLPDSLLAKRHKELLNKREVVMIQKNPSNGERVYEQLDQPDTQAVSKGLDMAYKLKKRYPDEEKGDTYTQINIFDAEQLKRIAKRALEEKDEMAHE